MSQYIAKLIVLIFLGGVPISFLYSGTCTGSKECDQQLTITCQVNMPNDGTRGVSSTLSSITCTSFKADGRQHATQTKDC